MSHFLQNAEEYQRDFNLLSAYTQDMAIGLQRVTGASMEECVNHVQSVIDNKTDIMVRDPRISVVARDPNGDRKMSQSTLMRFIGTVQDKGLIISPSMTVYKPPEQQRSITAEYIAKQVKLRKQSKKDMFQAGLDGDIARKEFKSNEQLTRKIKANGLSGAHCSQSTILHCPTIHSSLTSTCRSASGYGNAHNERLIAGNRHYWNPDIATANILSVIRQSNLEQLEQVIQQFQLHYPNADEALAVVRRSSDPYWINKKRIARIHRLLESLEPIERAAFVYVGDFYHIAQHNRDFACQFLTLLSYRDEDTQIDHPKQAIEGLTDELVTLVSLLCAPFLQGEVLAEFDKLDAKTQQIVGATAYNVTNALNDYHNFIRAIFVNTAMPPSIANLPDIYRRCAITSDTDSTIYTAQEWVRWYYGELKLDEPASRIAHAISFLSSTSIMHTLAMMCANIGVRSSQIFQYTMKSEFYFPTFALTSRAKTYFASVAAQEGQVLTNYDYEVKGAVLQGSNSPQEIIDRVWVLMRLILHSGEGIQTPENPEGKKTIALVPILEEVSYLENRIYESVTQGRTEFYKTSEIKPADSYKLDSSRSPYFYYSLWQKVFSSRYGLAANPPYEVLRITLDINNKTDFQQWLQNMPDDMQESLISVLKENNKGVLQTLQIPRWNAEMYGVPPEIIKAISVRDIIATLMEPFYAILETLGYFTLDDHRHRLVFDRYQPVDHGITQLKDA